MTTKNAPTAPGAKPSTSAKILYRPVGIVSSIAGGLIASAIFKQVWKRVSAGEGVAEQIAGGAHDQDPGHSPVARSNVRAPWRWMTVLTAE